MLENQRKQRGEKSRDIRDVIVCLALKVKVNFCFSLLLYSENGECEFRGNGRPLVIANGGFVESYLQAGWLRNLWLYVPTLALPCPLLR